MAGGPGVADGEVVDVLWPTGKVAATSIFISGRTLHEANACKSDAAKATHHACCCSNFPLETNTGPSLHSNIRLVLRAFWLSAFVLLGLLAT